MRALLLERREVRRNPQDLPLFSLGRRTDVSSRRLRDAQLERGTIEWSKVTFSRTAERQRGRATARHRCPPRASTFASRACERSSWGARRHRSETSRETAGAKPRTREECRETLGTRRRRWRARSHPRQLRSARGRSVTCRSNEDGRGGATKVQAKRERRRQTPAGEGIVWFVREARRRRDRGGYQVSCAVYCTAAGACESQAKEGVSREIALHRLLEVVDEVRHLGELLLQLVLERRDLVLQVLDEGLDHARLDNVDLLGAPLAALRRVVRGGRRVVVEREDVGRAGGEVLQICARSHRQSQVARVPEAEKETEAERDARGARPWCQS